MIVVPFSVSFLVHNAPAVLSSLQVVFEIVAAAGHKTASSVPVIPKGSFLSSGRQQSLARVPVFVHARHFPQLIFSSHLILILILLLALQRCC